MNIFIPFTKTDAEQRMVYGYASTEALDSQGEIVSRDAIINALPDYMRFRNIREMHQSSAVGKTQEAKVDEKGLFIGVKVVDESAWQKVKETVYNGFSIGGKIVTKIDDTITELKLTEISLVDRPANPEAVFSFYKGESMDKEIKVEKSDEALEILKGFMGEEVYDANTALSALESIMWLLGDEKRESENNPEQIAALQAAVKNIKAFIVSEIQEDNGSGEAVEGNLVVALSDKVGDIAKAGAAISTANKDKLSQIMALCKEIMGEEEESGKGDNATDLTKGEDIAKAFGDLQNAHNEAIAKMATMQSRIAELEAMPTAPKGPLKSISKGDDYSREEDDGYSIIKNHDGTDNSVASMIKDIHSGRIR